MPQSLASASGREERDSRPAGKKETQAEVPHSSCSGSELRVVKEGVHIPRGPGVAVELGSLRELGLALQQLSVHRAGVGFLEKDHGDLWLGHLHPCLHCPARRRLQLSLGTTPQLWVASWRIPETWL